MKALSREEEISYLLSKKRRRPYGPKSFSLLLSPEEEGIMLGRRGVHSKRGGSSFLREE